MDALISEIGKYGLVPLLLAVSITFNVILFKTVVETQEKRINDIKETKDNILLLLNSIKQTADLTLSGLQSIVKRK